MLNWLVFGILLWAIGVGLFWAVLYAAGEEQRRANVGP